MPHDPPGGEYPDRCPDHDLPLRGGVERLLRRQLAEAMSATLWHLNRHHDISGVSGEGDDVATICEFPSGLIALHWNSDTPSVTVYTDIRHVEKLHGHKGASTVEIAETRLERAYRVVMPWLLAGGKGPFMCGPHPDMPDRLRLVFEGQAAWAQWVALFDGSTYAATHTEVNAEMQHTWVSPDGDLWLQYFSPLADDNDPLTTFDREDR